MTRRTGLLLLAGVAAAVAIVFTVRFLSDQTTSEGPTLENEPAKIVISEGGDLPMRLLFPGAEGKLHTVVRQLPQLEGTENKIRQLIETLLEGPQSEALYPLFEIAVDAVDILLTEDSRVYVNLLSSEHRSPPPMGTHQEMLTVFAIVNSVISNFPEVRGVVLLWNGEQNSTFAGHIDTSLPLLVDASLIANPGE